MSLTKTAKEFYQYCNTHEFIPESVIEKFKTRLEQEDNLMVLSVGLEKFRDDRCPNCNATGLFKWHFLGKLKHPDCGWSWFVGPGAYTGAQLRSVFRTGMEIGAEIHSDAEKKGEKGGCIGAFFGFFIGLGFRLPFALLMIPIQAIVSLSQSRPEAKVKPE